MNDFCNYHDIGQNYWLQLGSYNSIPTQQKLDNLNQKDKSTVEVSIWQCNDQVAASLYSFKIRVLKRNDLNNNKQSKQ